MIDKYDDYLTQHISEVSGSMYMYVIYSIQTHHDSVTRGIHLSAKRIDKRMDTSYTLIDVHGDVVTNAPRA